MMFMMFIMMMIAMIFIMMTALTMMRIIIPLPYHRYLLVTACVERTMLSRLETMTMKMTMTMLSRLQIISVGAQRHSQIFSHGWCGLWEAVLKKLCGAAIISPRLLLTAYHCTYHKNTTTFKPCDHSDEKTRAYF